MGVEDGPVHLPEDLGYFELLDAIPMPIVVHRGGPLLFANRAMAALTGYRKGDLIGMPYEALAAPEFREQAKQRGDARIRSEVVPSPYEFRLQTADEHTPCWVELNAARCMLNGLPTIIASFYDLSERRLADEEQRHLRQIMAQIVDGAPVPTFVLDAEHKVTHWNRACAEITGVPAADVVGTDRQWTAFYPAKRPVMADLVLGGTMEASIDTLYPGKFQRSAVIRDAYEAEDFFRGLGKNGRWLFFTAAPLHDASGRIIGAIETLQDVTARHLAEEALLRHQAQLEEQIAQRTSQLAQANEQLLQSEKLASIGQLAAGVAHEINNPIGYVHSNIGTLQTYIGDLLEVLALYEAAEASIASPEQRLAVKTRREAADIGFLREDIPMLMHESREGITRVKKIVQDLKDFSHVDNSLEWQLADLHRGIDSTLNVVNNEIKYKAEVVKAYGALPEVECLPSQLNQVFMNLLVNAAHAMGETRGRITIRTGTEGDAVWMEFSDNGIGIPENIQGKIFDPFFTTKPVGKGTGLGLSLSYGIIQKHNGRITLKSKPGEGSAFRIVLPVKHVESGATS